MLISLNIYKIIILYTLNIYKFFFLSETKHIPVPDTLYELRKGPQSPRVSVSHLWREGVRLAHPQAPLGWGPLILCTVISEKL